jgi:hypothetical protein
MDDQRPKSSSPILLVLGIVGGVVLVVLGLLVTIAVVGIRHRRSAVRIAEARATLGAIAHRYRATYRGGVTSSSRLDSFPAVPATIPRGTKFASTSADWVAWKPIGFEMGYPQRFQYEVRADAIGQSAEILARGDLNGDAKTSLFILRIHLDRGRPVFARSIEETDPEE